MERQRRAEFLQQYLKSDGPPKTFSVRESIDAFLAPCGRFKSPLSWRDTLELTFLQKISSSRIFKRIVAFPNYDILPNWQILLNYLTQQGVIPAPSFTTVRQRNDFPPTQRIKLSTHITPRLTDGHGVDIYAHGSGANAEEAYSKAVGELLERYTMTLYRTAKLRRGSHNELVRRGAHALDTTQLPAFLPWQKERFGEFAYSNDTQLRWAETTELVTGARAYVPAQLVFWNYNHAAAHEPWLQHATTNGGAGHFTFEESVLSSIYELVERDAYLLFWLNTLSPKRIALDTIDDLAIKERVAAATRHGLKLFFLDTTTDLSIPSCICVVVDDRGAETKIALGGSAGFDIYKNLRSSLNEALFVAQHDISYDLQADYKPFSDRKIGKNERLGVWHKTTMFTHFEFFISGEEIALQESRHYTCGKTYATKQEELEAVKRIFKDKGTGYELYCYRARHPVLTKLGYVITKVIVPKLVPLHLYEHLATLGAQRLQSVPAVLGYTNATLNPWPHPFS
jgi:ribosomal protein S12 methylthiotransferase accessory factor